MKGTFYGFALWGLVGTVMGQSGAWQQCGGTGYSGPTTCVSGYACSKINDYYSQCIPSSSSSSSSAPTSPSPTTTSTAPTPTATGTGPGTTLLPNYYWVRAVAAPNFHKYLQSSAIYTASDAVLNSYTTAGQFNIVSGQLVQVIDTKGTLLYAHVETRADSAVVKLKVSWSSSPDTYGTFAWSGDALTWTTSGITRPNNAAWLVCENQVLYANLGAYGYQTPAGCSDQTIHYYNGATAVD